MSLDINSLTTELSHVIEVTLVTCSSLYLFLGAAILFGLFIIFVCRPQRNMDKHQDELKTLKEKLQSLCDVFKCPVCWEVLDKDNISCINGHSVCTKCIGRREICPVCREKLSNLQQNAMVRQVLEVLSRKCKYHNCSELVRPGDNHEKYCRYRQTACEDIGCFWVGPVNELPYHLMNTHNKKILPESSSKACHLNFDLNKVIRYVTMHSAFGHYLWEIRKNDPMKGMLTYTYIPVLVGKPDHDIWVKRCYNRSNRMKWDIAIKINLDESVDHVKENSTSIPISMLHNFYDGQNVYFSRYVMKESE